LIGRASIRKATSPILVLGCMKIKKIICKGRFYVQEAF